MANCSLRIAGLADDLADLLPDVEARFAADGRIDPREQRVLDRLRGCAVEAEEQAGITPYALGLFRAKPGKRRLTEMRRDLEGLGVELGELPRTA